MGLLAFGTGLSAKRRATGKRPGRNAPAALSRRARGLSLPTIAAPRTGASSLSGRRHHPPRANFNESEAVSPTIPHCSPAPAPFAAPRSTMKAKGTGVDKREGARSRRRAPTLPPHAIVERGPVMSDHKARELEHDTAPKHPKGRKETFAERDPLAAEEPTVLESSADDPEFPANAGVRGRRGRPQSEHAQASRAHMGDHRHRGGHRALHRFRRPPATG